MRNVRSSDNGKQNRSHHPLSPRSQSEAPAATGSWIASCITPIVSNCAVSQCVKNATHHATKTRRRKTRTTRNPESCFYVEMPGQSGCRPFPLHPPHPRPTQPPLRCGNLRLEPSVWNPLLDDSDHFRDNHLASVAALRFLIGFRRNTDRLPSGTLIAIPGIRSQECISCSVLPMCLGGCRMQRMRGHRECISEKQVLDKFISNTIENRLLSLNK